MNIKILSLHSLLIIASCITGTAQSFYKVLSKQQIKNIYTEEMRQAKENHLDAKLTELKISEELLNKTEQGKIWLQKDNKCIKCNNSGIVCDTCQDKHVLAVRFYEKSSEYNSKFVPAYEKKRFNYLKIIFLDYLLADDCNGIETILKNLDGRIYYDPHYEVDFKKIELQVALYFQTLDDKINAAKLAVIENTMSEYQ